MKLADKIEYFLAGVSVIPFAWMVLSYINVICHNVTNYCYAPWNLFTLLF